jgi:hypothetical protein
VTFLFFGSRVPDKLEPPAYTFSRSYTVWPEPDPEPPKLIKGEDAEWLYELGLAWDEQWGLEEPHGNSKEEKDSRPGPN